jgi:ribosomal protein S11
MVYYSGSRKKGFFPRKKKSNFRFFLGEGVNRTAHLYMRKTFSNVFLTLTDLNDKVIICRSSGSSGIWRLKKRKASPYALERIVSKLNYHFRFFRIKSLKVFIKMRLNNFSHHLLRYLEPCGIQVVSFKRSICVPHNGMRGPRLPRK